MSDTHNSTHPPVLWVVTEGMAGTENQCLAVAASLGIRPIVKQISLREPWKTLTPHLGFECAWSFTGDELLAPFPDIIIAAGRKSIAACRYIKKKSPKTFITFLQNPRIDLRIFDLVAAPAHDHLSGANVITTIATPTKYNPDVIDDIKHIAPSPFSKNEKQNIGMIIGGGIAGRMMDQAEQNKIIAAATLLAHDDTINLFIIGSRRTPESLVATLRALNVPSWFYGSGQSNPYAALLAHSDALIVTADSPSMISDAISIGTQTYILGAPQTKRHADLVVHLTSSGFIQPYGLELIPYSYVPVNDSALIAAAIQEKLAKNIV